MRKYSAKINGTMYEIEIELIRGNGTGSSFSGSPSLPPQVSGGVSRPAPAPRSAAPAPAPQPAAQTASAAPAAAGEEQVTAPMPGTVLTVNVGPGSVVKKGQVLMSLEAMKMENEIMASRDGQIVSVSVTAGAAVEAGALLCVIK